MGDAPDGFGVQERLSSSQRQRLISHVAALPDDVRGTDVKRLATLVETAVVSTAPALSAEIEKVQRAVGRHIRPLMDAAKELLPLLPPEEGQVEFDDAARTLPWLQQFDHFDGVVTDIFALGQNEREACVKAADAVRNLVAVLGPLEVPHLRSGRKRKDEGMARAVVAAVCFYRCEQGWTGQYWWGDDGLKAGDKDEGRRKELPVPGTGVALLLTAVADALDLPEANATLKNLLDRYGRQLKAEGRGPMIEDFSLEDMLAAQFGLGK